MDIFVCIKRVPDTSEAEVSVDESGKEVDSSRFSFDINEADNYAVEEALLLKERLGGTVQVVCVDCGDVETIIRMALAKGADGAIQVNDGRVNAKDPLVIARVLAAVIGQHQFDLVLTGCMAGDDGYMTVGAALAEELTLPCATMVKKVEPQGGRLSVCRELEGGLLEEVDIALPAVLTIQTGINEPRYASIRGVRQAQKKEIKVLKIEDLEIAEEEAAGGRSSVEMQELYVPEVVSRAELIEGEPAQKAEVLAGKLVKGGLL